MARDGELIQTGSAEALVTLRKKMATLMNSSSFFVFKTSLLRNYCVKYYDYVVK